MKKRTRKQIAGALAICIMMGAPANLCSVEAASSLQGEVFPPIWEDTDTETESVEESVSETVESETVESETEESETVCSETESSDENSSSTVEGDEQTESESENQRPDTDKSCAFDRIYRDSGSSFVLTEITNDGVLDYRTYFQGDQKPKIRIEMDRNILCTASGGGLTEPKDRFWVGNDRELTYVIKYDDSNILYFDESGKGEQVHKNQASVENMCEWKLSNEYKSQDIDAFFEINGVGNTVIRTGILQDGDIISNFARWKIWLKDRAWWKIQMNGREKKYRN